MNHEKSILRNKFILHRKKNFFKVKRFRFNSLFGLIKKKFRNKKITIAGYYPANYEVNVLKFLQQAEKKKFKIVLPIIKSSNAMFFQSWTFKEPLYVNKFGILEPKNLHKKTIPDLVMVPLVAFDNQFNRIG